MFSWLRNWLAVTPTPIHIDISAEAVAVARPGDVIFITCGRLLRTKEREAIHEFMDLLAGRFADLRFVILEPPLCAEVKGARQ